MKRIGVCLLSLLVVSTAWAADGNRVILRVNDRIVTLYDYELRRDDRLRAVQQADLDPARRAEMVARVGPEVMNSLLEEMLVLSRADQIGFRPTEDDIDQAVERSKQSFGLQTEEEFEQALQASGMTSEGFRRQVEVNIRVSSVMGREVQQRVDLSEEDLRRYYYEHEDEFTVPERLRLQEVVVLDSSSLSPEAREALAEELRTGIEAGSAMADQVAPHSAEGTTSGVVELGWIEQGDLDETLEQAVWNLAAGGVSAPTEARGGLHLIEVLERTAPTILPFQEVEGQIDRIERERLLQQEYEAYLAELQESAYIRMGELPEELRGFSVGESASRLTDVTSPDPSSKEDDEGSSAPDSER